MLRIILLSVVFTFICGFLLDDKNSQTSVDHGKQYLTLDDKLQLIHDLEKIRTEQQETINTLTTQLKQRLSEMETQIINSNETCKPMVEVIEKKYNELEKNYTKLRENFDQFRSKQSVDIAVIKNKTYECELKVKALEQLKNVNQLQYLTTLDNKVKSVDSSVSLLLSHEQARNQDFLALFNMTKQTSNQFTDFKNQTANKFKIFENFRMQSLTQIKHLEEGHNTTLMALKQQGQLPNNTKQRVAVTVCHQTSATLSGNSVIKFPDVLTSDGLTKLSTFRSTGKFVCEVSGLYFISATVMSNTQDSHFYLRKNNVEKIHSFLGEIKTHYRSNTADMVTDLTVGDTISVTTAGTMYIYEYSCLTIFKVA